MSTQIGIGTSTQPNPQQAATEAAAQIKAQFGTATPDLIIVFCTTAYATTEAITTVQHALNPKYLIGCSTAGILLSNAIIPHGIAILGLISSDIHLGISSIVSIGTSDLRQAGFTLAREATSSFRHSHRQSFIFFADGIYKNNSAFVRGAQEVLGNGFSILGAVSSDSSDLKKTFQFYQNQVLNSSAVGLLIGGSSSFAMGCKHGFKPLGKPRTIDNAQGNIIRTIDGKPAVHIYKEYFGDEAKNLKTTTMGSMAALYPLGIYMEQEKQYLLRNAVDILNDGSIVCQGEVPQGAEVHLMIGNKDSCIKAAMEAAQEVKDALGDKQAKCILVLESMTRYKILGRKALAEVQAIKKVLGDITPIFGMYSFGEIAPFGLLGVNHSTHLQNESIVIMAIG